MLSLYSSFLVLPGEEAEADVALGKPSATAPTAILATQEIECVLVSKIIILKDKIKDKKEGFCNKFLIKRLPQPFYAALCLHS